MLTHLDKQNRPQMVDIGDKQITCRIAKAEAIVSFPAEVYEALMISKGETKKGVVIDTAIIAGTMAAKKTHDLIPFCHPLPIDSCKFHIEYSDNYQLLIQAEIKTHHKTGVEMEALTAVSVAALTVYDMCKALSHHIVIKDIHLLSKEGGKSGSFQSTKHS